MPDSPKISVIIPTYNNERYLSQCLDSLKKQTLHDFEAICINDGSTDNSLSIMQRYHESDERFIVVDKPNSGYGHSMNCGLDKARGAFVAILESDDFLEPTMFEELYELAEKKDLDFVKADFQAFYGEGDSLRFEYKRICPNRSLYNVVIEPSQNLAAFDVDMVTWTGIYRRSFLEDNGIRYNETPGAAYQDNGFWLQTFAFAKRVMFVPKAFYQYRQDNPNSSINSKTKVFCMCEEHAFMHSFIADHPTLDRRLYRMWSKRMFHNYNFTYQRIAPEYKKQFLERYASDFRQAFERGEVSKDDFYEDEWARLNDIVDDPHMAYLKLEDVMANVEDRIVERHQLRQCRATIDDLSRQLAVYRKSNVYRFAGKIKRVNDYRYEYGMGQLIKRALFKTPATKRPEQTNTKDVPPVAFANLPGPALAHADAYPSLDCPQALESWYRRKTGMKLNLDDPHSAEELVQRSKLSYAQVYAERIGSLSRVFEYARGLIDEKLLPQNAVRFDSIELLENYLFEHRPSSFIVKSNAKLAWSVYVQDASCFSFDVLKYHYRWLADSNLAFVAGEPLAPPEEIHALYLMRGSCADASNIVKIAVACSDGAILGSIEKPLRKSESTVRMGEDGLPGDIADAAADLSRGFPFVNVVFERTPQEVTLASLECGLDEGLVGSVDDALEKRIAEALLQKKG